MTRTRSDAPPGSAPFDLAFAELCALWVATVDAMYLRDPSDVRPAFRPDDSRIGGYALRAHITMRGVDGERRFYGALAQNESDADEFVLAFRGTRSGADYVANALFALSRFSEGRPGSGCVHRGWRALFRSARVTDAGGQPSSRDKPDFVADVNATIAAYQARGRRDAKADASAVKLAVTAHSLGAAIATMFVVENAALEGTVRPSSIYTLASPMVGDAAFVARFNALATNSHRIVVDRDTVPKLPGKRWGYRHVEREVVLTSRAIASPRRTHDIRTYRALLGWKR